MVCTIRGAMLRGPQFVFACLLVGCTAPTSAPAPAPQSQGAPSAVARLVSSAAAEAGVPADLLVAIAIEEGGVKLPAMRLVRDDDNVPVAGLLELRHGRLDTLALGAQLMGTTEDALRADTELGTRAGARVLATLGAQYGATTELASWRRALEVLSGMDDDSARDYASRVLTILRDGGDYPARDAEQLRLVAHPERGQHARAGLGCRGLGIRAQRILGRAHQLRTEYQRVEPAVASSSSPATGTLSSSRTRRMAGSFTPPSSIAIADQEIRRHTRLGSRRAHESCHRARSPLRLRRGRRRKWAPSRPTSRHATNTHPEHRPTDRADHEPSRASLNY